jgi:hypothetical protein
VEGVQELAALRDLSSIVDLAAWDLAAATFETRSELSAYCTRWSSAMVRPVLSVADGGSASSALFAAAQTLGATLRELEMLESLEQDARHGRLRLPLDELASAGVEPTTVARSGSAEAGAPVTLQGGGWPDALAGLIRECHENLRTALGQSVAALGVERQPALRGLLVWAALAFRASRRAERALPRAYRPGRFDPLLDGWHAWRAARSALMRRFRIGSNR